MIALDAPTLHIVSALAIIATGVFFILETLLRRNDAVGRLWSVFYVGSMFAVFAALVGASSPDTWWAYAIGNGFYVAATGLVWAGARVANRRRSMMSIPVLAGVFVALARLLAGPDGVVQSGAAVTYLGAGILLALAAVEFASRDLRKFAAGPFLALTLGVTALFYGARSATFLAIGADDSTYQALFGPTSSSLVEITTAIIATLALSSIQADRFKRAEQIDADFGQRVAIDGVLLPLTFREMAESWLMRAIRERTTLVLLMIEIADLSEVNVAFGRAAGDAAIRTTGRLTLLHAPTASVIGRVSPRRFVMLMELPTTDAVETIADDIRDAVLATQLDDQDRFRASIYRGIASTRTSGARYDDLVRAASEAVALDRSETRERAEDAAI